MSTSFLKKCEILAEVQEEASWNKDLDEFKRINDIGLPMAYMVHNDLIQLKNNSNSFIEETWLSLCSVLKVDPDEEYEGAENILFAAGIYLNEEEEEDK